MPRGKGSRRVVLLSLIVAVAWPAVASADHIDVYNYSGVTSPSSTQMAESAIYTTGMVSATTGLAAAQLLQRRPTVTYTQATTA